MLARQIEQGAPADLFISADELRMDELQRRGLIVPRSRRSILSNTLVIIIPSDSARKISSPQDLIGRRAAVLFRLMLKWRKVRKFHCDFLFKMRRPR